MSLEIFSVGACLLSAPVTELISSNRATNSWNRYSKHITPAVYTLDEALQLVRFMRGDFDIPPLFRELCRLDRSEEGPPLKGALDTADVVLVEINSPVAIRYSRYALCRSQLISLVLNYVKTSDELARAGNAWYHQGIMADNAEVREETAQKLVRAVPDTMPDPDLARAVLIDSRPSRRDVAELAEGLAELRDAFRAPLGVVTYTHQYMPDGRPLPWPADFIEQTMAAAQQLALPVFHPSNYVRSYGATRALMPDRVHYQPEFSAALAEPLWEFAAGVAGVSSSTPAVTPAQAPAGQATAEYRVA
ncbi:MAG: hypothetical protein K2X72_19770 [Reyranella sp.]|nr:hypothetical protein [Reyranella sp.]